MRWVILGNAGAGKTTRARALGAEHGAAILSLDGLAFEEGATRRPLADSIADVKAFLDAHDRWVVEGCYADLAATALERATDLLFLDPGVEACVSRCRGRAHEPDKFATKAEQDAMLEHLIAWVRQYETRDDEYGRARHLALFEAFEGRKTRDAS